MEFMRIQMEGATNVNNSKKLRTKKVKKDRLIESKPITMISKPWIITAAVLLVVLIGALLFDQFYERTILTIDGKAYKLSDLSYYIYSVESNYDYYDQMFGGSGAYWDMVLDEETGATLRDEAKLEVVDRAVQNEILYKEAVDAGYTLTQEEKDTINTNAENMLNTTFTSSMITKGKFTKSRLTTVLGKITLTARFREDKIESFDIDDEAIKAGINYDEYRQYDIETLYISTETTDEDGNSAAMTEEEKAAALEKLTSYYDKAETTEDWSTLLPEEETEVTYRDTSFLESGSTYSEDMEAMMMELENGAVSEIYEAEDGYYIVRMKDNNSTESYDSAVSSAISEEENKRFTEFYEELEANHEYSTNEGALKSLNMGSVIID